MIRPNDFRVSKVKNEKHYAPFSAIDIANIFESEISVNIDIDAALAGHTSNDYKLPLVLCADSVRTGALFDLVATQHVHVNLSGSTCWRRHNYRHKLQPPVNFAALLFSGDSTRSSLGRNVERSFSQPRSCELRDERERETEGRVGHVEAIDTV